MEVHHLRDSLNWKDEDFQGNATPLNNGCHPYLQERARPYIILPRKFNMEPENDGETRGASFSRDFFSGSMLIFGV